MEVAERQSILAPGDKLGCYRIDSFLGQGGFGVTYLAHDTMLDLQVAIKEYLPEKIAKRVAGNKVRPTGEENGAIFRHGLVNFLKEARTLARFKHPNIVRVMSIFELNGTAYMVMEYERGHDLKLLFNRREHTSEEQLLSIIGPVIDGLDEVHRHGFIHRDIKPANILVRDNGSPVLLDFGSARLAVGNDVTTMTAMVTVGFAPLEQYSGLDEQQGPWTDIYALGAVLYYAITGDAPLDSTLRGAAVLNDKPDPLVPLLHKAPDGISESFCKAVDWALKFKVSERPQNLTQWRAELFGHSSEDTDRENTSIANTAVLPAAAVKPVSSGDRQRKINVEDAPTVIRDLPLDRPEANARLGNAFEMGSAQTLMLDDKWDISDISRPSHRPRSRARLLPVALMIAMAAVVVAFRPWNLLQSDAQPDTSNARASEVVASSESFVAEEIASPVEAAEKPTSPPPAMPASDDRAAQQQAIREGEATQEQQEQEQEQARSLLAQLEVDRAVQRVEARRVAALQAQSEQLAEEQAQKERDIATQRQAELAATRKRQESSREAARVEAQRNAVKPPITNAEMNQVLTRFNALSKAIEAGDGEAMRRLTVPSDRKNAYFDYAFDSFAKIEVRIGNISVSRQDQKVRATLSIDRLIYNNGSAAVTPEEFRNIPIYSVKEAKWSEIHW